MALTRGLRRGGRDLNVSSWLATRRGRREAVVRSSNLATPLVANRSCHKRLGDIKAVPETAPMRRAADIGTGNQPHA